jgi:ABC-type methionine transport system permease subunit
VPTAAIEGKRFTTCTVVRSSIPQRARATNTPTTTRWPMADTMSALTGTTGAGGVGATLRRAGWTEDRMGIPRATLKELITPARVR